MHKALHPRDDVDRLYVSRKEERREIASIEDSIDKWDFNLQTDGLTSARSNYN